MESMDALRFHHVRRPVMEVDVNALQLLEEEPPDRAVVCTVATGVETCLIPYTCYQATS